ncbi:MAG: trypsin-like serine protease, partial [Archangium sp.]|nr:trypsin-like serine protease [Archangium sp.]
MTIKAGWFALVSVACWSACGPTEDLTPQTAERSDEIIGGTLAMGDPATVALTVRYGGQYESVCTGTLIAPKTVLTAAHCIYAYGQNAPYYVTFGTYSAQPTRAVQVVSQTRHPSYNQSAWDFGLLRLASPVLDVTPFPMNETPITQSMIGRSIRHVGF